MLALRNSEDGDEAEVMEYDTGLAVGPNTATCSNEDPECPFGNCFEDHNHYGRLTTRTLCRSLTTSFTQSS